MNPGAPRADLRETGVPPETLVAQVRDAVAMMARAHGGLAAVRAHVYGEAWS